jgi:hypothetical protein
MHTVHLPPGGVNKGGFMASAMGLMFSVDKYDKKVTAAQEAIIDEFFDSLKWDVTDKNPKVQEVTYGKLMMMADMNNRWTYTGSVTTPPCAESVYWNVLRTIYPVKKRHLDQFKNQLKRPPNILDTGNFRLIQAETKDHNPYIITGGSALSTGQMDLNINVNQAGPSVQNLASKGPAGKSDEFTSTNGYLETVTILLIVAILFLLIAVLCVVRNTFDKRPYQPVDGAGASNQAEGGEEEMANVIYQE